MKVARTACDVIVGDEKMTLGDAAFLALKISAAAYGEQPPCGDCGEYRDVVFLEERGFYCAECLSDETPDSEA